MHGMGCADEGREGCSQAVHQERGQECQEAVHGSFWRICGSRPPYEYPLPGPSACTVKRGSPRGSPAADHALSLAVRGPDSGSLKIPFRLTAAQFDPAAGHTLSLTALHQHFELYVLLNHSVACLVQGPPASLKAAGQALK